MCGIVGYIGKKKASNILLNSLKKLEYRGYDSVGMAILHNNKLSVRKDIGMVEEVDRKLHFEEMGGNIGIAHTRWSTHGKVTKENAHPHLSNDGKIAVVHNGIIENYQELKKFLAGKGFRFYSETDTEVIPNLIQYFMSKKKNFISATKEALPKLKGSYALLIINNEQKLLLAARKESPLVIGIGRNEYFAASDIPSFLEHTKKVI